ncbi:transcription antitermination factor NusB [Paenibacillus antri]|uniref:Transcription antitermination protein NusB n=1 Tax=Paenibacillus antri TaxID=2582848 RepID=A0A5R9GB89_9BACL|nr:transcription antitermination factor NusB [Paenibacillus antri]TLS53001.1 transcription antitermination factor NusB [Paenibacillus antri]
MKRRSARVVAVQCLYQMEMNRVPAHEALQAAMEEALNDNESGTDVSDADALLAYVRGLLDKLVPLIPEIDGMLTEFLQGYQVDRLSRVDREVLRLAVFEMIYADDVPPKVAVNEAIEVAKHFGTDESGKFVNGVLGKMVKQVDELKAKANA